MKIKSYECHCCGSVFDTKKPQGWNHDKGYGCCKSCSPDIEKDMIKYQGYTPEKASAYMNKYA